MQPSSSLSEERHSISEASFSRILCVPSVTVLFLSNLSDIPPFPSTKALSRHIMSFLRNCQNSDPAWFLSPLTWSVSPSSKLATLRLMSPGQLLFVTGRPKANEITPNIALFSSVQVKFVKLSAWLSKSLHGLAHMANSTLFPPSLRTVASLALQPYEQEPMQRKSLEKAPSVLGVWSSVKSRGFIMFMAID